MRFYVAIVLMGTFAFSSSVAEAVDVSGIKLNPGERLIAVDGKPVDGVSGQSVAGSNNRSVVQVSARSAGGQGMAANIVGNLVNSGMPFSHTPGATALDKANHERRKNGVGNLIPDPQLQQLALQKAQIAAARGHKNHIGGSLGGARAEGVGHTNGRFLSCCLDMPATYGGAAMVQGRDGWYCCLLVR
jgi:hypothetical protein